MDFERLTAGSNWQPFQTLANSGFVMRCIHEEISKLEWEQVFVSSMLRLTLYI